MELLRQIEAILALVAMDPSFASVLFDFADRWKGDLGEFMESSYMFALPLEEFAQLSGRSLSTFKRDFKEFSPLSPEKWLVQRRLEAAYKMLEGGATVSEACMRSGFRNLSHFSTTFKKHYGVSPIKVSRMAKAGS